jgi:glycosyltransferase involved in cell wall biosynthesis
MKITAVIPTYNLADYIRRAVDSVLTQTRQADEIIVVDDGSTDQTSEILETYEDRIRYIRQDNAGASAARNTGIQAASGDWIAFLDGDDQWLAHHLEKQTALLEKHPNLVWSTGNFYRNDETSQWEETPEYHKQSVRDMLIDGDYFNSYFQAYPYRAAGWTGTMVIRKEALLEAGLFRPGQKRINDIDMWLRIAYRHPRIGFIIDPQAVYYVDIRESITKKYTDPAITCEFIDRHLELSKRYNCHEAFLPCAAIFAGWGITCQMAYRNGTGVRLLLKKYGYLFDRYFQTTNWIKSWAPGLGLWYDRLREDKRRKR